MNRLFLDICWTRSDKIHFEMIQKVRLVTFILPQERDTFPCSRGMILTGRASFFPLLKQFFNRDLQHENAKHFDYFTCIIQIVLDALFNCQTFILFVCRHRRFVFQSERLRM